MILFDFESPGLSSQWEMGRGGSASREAYASGWCLHVNPVAGSGIASRSVPTDWTRFGELTFRVRAAAATTIEVRVPAGERRAAWWRRVDLREGGWQDVRIPLGWTRRADGPAPSWSTVRALSFSFRDGTEVWIDDIAVRQGSPVLTPEAIAQLSGGVVTRGHRAAVISLVPGIDAVALAGRLDAIADAVLADLPFLAVPAVPVPLVIYPDEAAYRAGVGRIGAAFAANAETPGHDGYTLEGIATSSWDPAQGVGRPVYGHEFVHALLTRTASLPNGGEWLQEGLASWYQARFYPQLNLSEVIRGRLARPLPLSRLCDGERIDTSVYGDAWAVIGTLREDPRWAGTLARVFEAAAQTGTTALDALGVDLAVLEADRRAWAARHFGW